MADHVYSASPSTVSRFLALKGFQRSRERRRQLANSHTPGFKVTEFLGSTQVFWISGEQGEGDVDAVLKSLAEALEERYEVERRREMLIVSEKVIKPEGLYFYKARGRRGLEYRAETETRLYVVRRRAQDPMRWELLVWSLRPEGGQVPTMVADKLLRYVQTDTKGEAIDVAFAHLKKVSGTVS
jgi:hypothetical protein